MTAVAWSLYGAAVVASALLWWRVQRDIDSYRTPPPLTIDDMLEAVAAVASNPDADVFGVRLDAWTRIDNGFVLRLSGGFGRWTSESGRKTDVQMTDAEISAWFRSAVTADAFERTVAAFDGPLRIRVRSGVVGLVEDDHGHAAYFPARPFPSEATTP